MITLLVLVPCGQAQQLDLIANTEGRKTISLDGKWQSIVDPYESGFSRVIKVRVRGL
jgi:beta-glucuronidase